MEDLSGKTLGQYKITNPIGEGGMSSLYKAYQAGMDRYVAIKVLPRHIASDPEFVQRFEQEARIIAKLQHPHILPVFDYGEQDGYTYIVMPFVETGTLANYLKGDPLPMKQICQVMSQVGDALDYAHSQNIVHRDVKPSNILVDERGNCMLTDFGIGKILTESSQITITGVAIGTPSYMSPEQGLGGKLDSRSDIYSLGVMLYEMVTGRKPYDGETPMAVIIKQIYDPLPLPRSINPWIPESIERIILKAMAKDRDERFGTANEIVAALECAAAEIGSGRFGIPTMNQASSGYEDQSEVPGTGQQHSSNIAIHPPTPNAVTPSISKGGFSKRINNTLAVIGGLAILFGVVFTLFRNDLNLPAYLGGNTSVVAPLETQTPTPPSSNTPTPSLTVTLQPSQTTSSTSTSTPPNTQVPSDTPSPTNPVATIGSCAQFPNDFCIFSFGTTSDLQLITLRFPTPPQEKIYLLLNRDEFECESMEDSPEYFYCTGPLQPKNRSLKLKVFRLSDELLLAEGTVIFPQPLTATPSQTPTRKSDCDYEGCEDQLLPTSTP
jgi:serine/threonine protein kinase